MIKAIIFDAGDVFLKGNFLGFVERSCDAIGIDYISQKAEFENKYLSSKLHLGEIDHISAFEEFFDKKLTSSQKELLLGYYDDSYRPDLQMRKLAIMLKRNYLIAILSNSDSRFEHMAEEDYWYDIFDSVFYSHRLHMIKPDKRLYLYAAKAMDLLPSECLFIDNNPKFVEGARNAGMRSIMFTSYLDLVNEFKKIEIRY
jgi:HAD superfamily hydrolase (TIGR01509 family)